MARVRTNNVFGTITDNPLTNVATTMNSAGLANLAAVTAPDTALITLDPNRVSGAPEIVLVTAHTAAATSATIVRGDFGTAARQHALGTEWVHGPVATVSSDLGDYPERVGVRLRRAAVQSIPNAATTAISWDTEDQDTNGFIAVTATTITVPTGLGGVYAVSASVAFAGGSITGRGFLDIVAGGRTWRGSLDSNIGEDQIAHAATVALADAATARVDVFQTTGGARNATAILEMFRLGP